MATFTDSSPIGASQSAVILLDYQKDLTERWYKKEDVELKISNVNKIIDQIHSLFTNNNEGNSSSKNANVPALIYYLHQHDKKPEEGPEEDVTYDFRLHTYLEDENAVQFTKTERSAFTNEKLEHYLKERNIKKIFMTGLDGCACVFATSDSARKLGLEVTLIEDTILNTFPEKWEKASAAFKDRLQVGFIQTDDMLKYLSSQSGSREEPPL